MYPVANKNLAQVTIANGTSLSDAYDLGDHKLCGILMPSAWSPAVITLAVSMDGVTFYSLYDDLGNEYTLQAAASRAIIIDPADLEGFSQVKIRSGSGAGTNQLADRTIGLVLRL